MCQRANLKAFTTGLPSGGTAAAILSIAVRAAVTKDCRAYASREKMEGSFASTLFEY